MNPFLVEPVYKRPKRKPAAKKKPAVKRKAPVRKPAAKRRGGTKAVYIEDYASPYDPIGLWSAEAKNVLGPKVVGKVPLSNDTVEDDVFHDPTMNTSGGSLENGPGAAEMLAGVAGVAGSAAVAGASGLYKLGSSAVNALRRSGKEKATKPAVARADEAGPSNSKKDGKSGSSGGGSRATAPATQPPGLNARLQKQFAGGVIEIPPGTKPHNPEESSARIRALIQQEEAEEAQARARAQAQPAQQPKKPAFNLAALEAETARREAEAAAVAGPSHATPADLALRGFNAVRAAKLDKQPSPKSREWLALTLTPAFVANVEKATERPFATVTDAETAKKVIGLDDPLLLAHYMRGITNQKQYSGTGNKKSSAAKSAAEAMFTGDKPPGRLKEALDKALGPIAEDEGLELGAQQRRATRKRKVTRPRR